MKTADRIAALLLFAICVAAWFLSRTFSPLSALFPRVVIIVLGLLSLLLLALSFTRSEKQEKFVLVHGAVLPVVLSVLMMVAWVVLIPLLGFLTSSLLLFTLMTLVLERRQRKPLQILLRIVIVCAATAAFYLFFDRLMLVSFPRGLLL